MKLNIPREFLWKDRETVEEFLDNPLFNALHEAFQSIADEPMLFPMDELAILNEVGYQTTWLCYESSMGLRPDMEQFTRMVFAHMGILDHAMTVISLVQAAVKLVNFPPLCISRQTKHELSRLNRESWCFRNIETFVRQLAKEGTIYDEQFKPYKKFTLDYVEEEEPYKDNSCMSAEPSPGTEQNNIRRFTMDDIVNYAKENLSLDNSVYIQNMLYALLSNDGTPEEREQVNSIPLYIRKRDVQPSYVGQMINRQNNLGDLSGLESKLDPEDFQKLIDKL